MFSRVRSASRIELRPSPRVAIISRSEGSLPPNASCPSCTSCLMYAITVDVGFFLWVFSFHNLTCPSLLDDAPDL